MSKDHQVIPAEAVEAALGAMRPLPPVEDRSRRRMVEVILAAAAPYMHARTLAYLDDAVRMGSTDPEVKDYERGFDDATRGMAAKVKRLLNGEAQ